ncbi:MAG: hypothetical protein ACKOFW_05565 [Planctomycetaceae bacterium]
MHWSLRCLAGLIVGGCFGTVAATVAGGLVGHFLPSPHPQPGATALVEAGETGTNPHNTPAGSPAVAGGSHIAEPPVDALSSTNNADNPWVTSLALLVGLATGFTFASAVWHRLGDVARTPPASPTTR